MKVGEIYFWEKNVSYLMEDSKLRYFKVLAVKSAHVYVVNTKTGRTERKDIGAFKENYVLVGK